MEKSTSAELQLEWRSRGPYNVGGRTRGLAIDVVNPNIYIAGGVSGGIWRSEDDGDTWKKMTKSSTRPDRPKEPLEKIRNPWQP